MTQSVLEKKKFTYEDYQKTPDDKRHELIGGELFMAPAPIPHHQKVSRELEFQLLQFVKKNNLGEIFDAPCDVYLDDENVVQPDILFISKDRIAIIGEKNIKGAPDLIIEIISESSAYRDMVQKKKLYARFGVKEYWIVVPEQMSIDIYRLGADIYHLHETCTKDGIVESPALPGLRLPLKEIF